MFTIDVAAVSARAAGSVFSAAFGCGALADGGVPMAGAVRPARLPVGMICSDNFAGLTVGFSGSAID